LTLNLKTDSVHSVFFLNHNINLSIKAILIDVYQHYSALRSCSNDDNNGNIGGMALPVRSKLGN
jgi:hypothetical protein